MASLRSRDNPRVKRWAKLSQDSRFRRAERRALIEGPHLVSALLGRGLRPLALLATEEAMQDAEIARLARQAGIEPVLLSTPVFRFIADAETPQGLAAEIEIPPAKDVRGSCAFLEGIQDAGNVGAIIRSAAAFGVEEIVLDNGCADPWSPKVLRAGMGGHFSLSVRGVLSLKKEIQSFEGKVFCTVASEGVSLSKADLSGRLGWVFGSEGRGLSPEVRKMGQGLSVGTASGTESLNVAAAAAICFYEAFSRPGAGS